MRIVFMGSPSYALPSLRRLVEAGHEVALVVSQPDRAAGRSRRPVAPPVAAYASDAGLPLCQPERLRSTEAQQPIRAARPDAIVVAAFGLLLPSAVLDLPPHGCLNVHPSLLPRWRGAAPIEATLLAGDAETGVTIIKLTERMDAGPILSQIRTPLGPDEDAPKLEARLAELGAELLVSCLGPWAAGRLTAVEQDETAATYCRRLERSDAALDWSRPAAELTRVVRAFRGRAGAFTSWEGRQLKVLAAEAREGEPGGLPGEVLAPAAGVRPRLPLVATGDGALLLREVALEGRPPTPGQAFLNGYPHFIGATLGGRTPDDRGSQESR